MGYSPPHNSVFEMGVSNHLYCDIPNTFAACVHRYVRSSMRSVCMICSVIKNVSALILLENMH